jgi:hypothetical protein
MKTRKDETMNRVITYQAQLFNMGNQAGKIVVTRQPGRPVRCSIGTLTKNSCAPDVRSWKNTHGDGIAIDLWVPETEATADHWATAEAVLKRAFPGIDIAYED